MSHFVRILAWALVAAGLFLTGTGVYKGAGAIAFTSTAIGVEGEVIAIEIVDDKDYRGKPSKSFLPRFRYVAEDGEAREAVTAFAASTYDFPVGSRMNLLVDPADPDHVRVDEFLSLYMAPIAYLIFGLLVLAMGLIARRFASSR